MSDCKKSLVEGDAMRRVFKRKGQIVVGTGYGSWKVVNLGRNGQVLVVNELKDGGVEWRNMLDVQLSVVDGGDL